MTAPAAPFSAPWTTEAWLAQHEAERTYEDNIYVALFRDADAATGRLAAATVARMDAAAVVFAPGGLTDRNLNLYRETFAEYRAARSQDRRAWAHFYAWTGTTPSDPSVWHGAAQHVDGTPCLLDACPSCNAIPDHL